MRSIQDLDPLSLREVIAKYQCVSPERKFDVLPSLCSLVADCPLIQTPLELSGVFIIDSGKKGPKVLLSAAVHGDEPCGVYVVEKLLSGFVEGTLTLQAGSLTLLIGNPKAFEINQREISEDLNRLFGSEAQVKSEEHERARLLEPLILHHSHYLDLHSFSAHGPVFAVSEEQYLDQATRLGVERIVLPGPFFEDVFRGTSIAYAGLRGISAVAVESGQHYDPDTFQHSWQVTNCFLASLGLISEAPALVVESQFYELYYKQLYQDGSFKFVRPFSNFDYLEQGQEIATTLQGVQLAPKDSYIIFPVSSERLEKLKPGEEVYFLAFKKWL